MPHLRHFFMHSSESSIAKPKNPRPFFIAISNHTNEVPARRKHRLAGTSFQMLSAVLNAIKLFSNFMNKI